MLSLLEKLGKIELTDHPIHVLQVPSFQFPSYKFPLTAHRVLSNDYAYQTRYLKYLIHHYDKTYPLYCSLQEKVIVETKNRAELAENQVELANNRADDAETQTGGNGVFQANTLTRKLCDLRDQKTTLVTPIFMQSIDGMKL